MRVWDQEPDDELEINIVPMIDVIFAILAFFILSTLFLTRSEGLPVSLPNAETADIQQGADITITIQEDGQLFLNQRPIKIAQIKAEIEASSTPKTSVAITVQADQKVFHGQVVEVMDILRTIEGATLGIATESTTKQQE
ncbi:MAG: biopolymer transporter ExbD [Cyanobacteria bacterium P01_G01_bin.38]